MNIYYCIRIDLKDTVSCNIYLIFTNSFSGCVNLTIDICQTYFIVIDQIQCSNTASYQSLYCISANAANSKYSNSGILQFLHSFFSNQ